jgi:hypothetical protein
MKDAGTYAALLYAPLLIGIIPIQIALIIILKSRTKKIVINLQKGKSILLSSFLFSAEINLFLLAIYYLVFISISVYFSLSRSTAMLYVILYLSIIVLVMSILNTIVSSFTNGLLTTYLIRNHIKK